MSQISTSVCCPQNAEGDIESDVTLNQDSATVLEAETVINTHNTSSQVEGSDDLKDLLTDEYCHICEAVLLFESQRTSHYEGKKHAQKVRLYLQSKKTQNPDKEATTLQAGVSMDKQKFCELCNMVFSSAVVAKSHYEGKIHAKNLRRFRPLDAKQKVDTAQPSLPQVPDRLEAVEDEMATSGSKVGSPASTQEVDLSDPTKHCRLCAATFNNPQMAQQHYSGRKHQRNQSRQQLLLQLGEDGETAGSLTCPICSVTLSSVEMYQAHMQGNKHQLKEKKVVDLCKSQKKVYDSFQDELADYIAVQKARGLQPKSAAKDKEREQEPGEGSEKPPAPPAPPAPPSLFAIRFPSPPPRLAQPPFQPPANRFAAWSRGRGAPARAAFWEPSYSQPRLNLPPSACSQGPVARRPARGRSPGWSSSSSSCSGSSHSSNSSRSSSSSESDDSRERRRRRQRRKHKERERRERERRGRKRGVREGEEEEKREGEEERAQKRSRRRDRKEGEGEKEEERKRRNERERRRRKELLAEEREERRPKRERQRKRPHEEEEDEERAKKRREVREEEQTMGERENAGADASGRMREEGADKANGQGGPVPVEAASEEKGDQRERHKHKHKKEKKRKERTEEVDTRTEEEKLWDETILGTF